MYFTWIIASTHCCNVQWIEFSSARLRDRLDIMDSTLDTVIMEASLHLIHGIRFRHVVMCPPFWRCYPLATWSAIKIVLILPHNNVHARYDALKFSQTLPFGVIHNHFGLSVAVLMTASSRHATDTIWIQYRILLISLSKIDTSTLVNYLSISPRLIL